MQLILIFAFVVQLICISNAQDYEIEGRLSNSNEAKNGSFPWMAGIQSKNENDTYDVLTCGGALISNNLVLTASSCIEKGSKFRVILGSLLVGDNPEDPNRIVCEVTEVMKSGEVSLLLLDKPVTFNSLVKAIELPRAQDSVGNNISVVTSGWGKLVDRNNGDFASTLHFYDYITIDDSECRKKYRIAAESGEFCLFAENSSACDGDYGNPVVRYVEKEKKPVHIGIIQWSNCHVDEPFIASRTSSFVVWIKRMIRKHSQ